MPSKLVAPASRIKRSTKRIPGVSGSVSHIPFRKKYLIEATRQRKTAFFAQETPRGNSLRTISIYSPAQARTALINSSKALSTPKTNKRIGVEIGDHYLFSEIDHFNAAHIYGEALINALELKNVVRTTLTDDVHVRLRTGSPKADIEQFAKWINLRGKRIHNLTESSAQEVFLELKEMCGWSQLGECKYYDAILYIRKLGLEQKVANYLSRKHKVSRTVVLNAFKHLPEIPVAYQSIVVLPLIDEKGQRLATQQNQTKHLLTSLFGVSKVEVNRRVKTVYYDPRKLKKMEADFRFLAGKKLSPLRQTHFTYKILTLGNTTPKDFRNARGFLIRFGSFQGTSNSNTAGKMVYFNELVNVLNQFPSFKKRFQQGEMDAIGSYHSSLVKTILFLESEIKQRERDGALSSSNLIKERLFNQVLFQAETTLMHSLKLMGCQKLAA